MKPRPRPPIPAQVRDPEVAALLLHFLDVAEQLAICNRRLDALWERIQAMPAVAAHASRPRPRGKPAGRPPCKED